MTKSINRKLAELVLPSTTVLKESVLDDISAGVTPYATLDDLPTSNLTLGDQAFVTSNQRLYLSNGSGWYNVAMFNATPNLTISPSGVITLATDGSTPTVITLTGTDSDNADANLIYSVESDGNFGGLATLSQDSSVFTITPLAEGSATTTASTLTFKVSDGINFGSGTTEFNLTFGPDWTVAPTETKLAVPDLPNNYFGESVSISTDGNYAIVGSRLNDGGLFTGAAYIYVRSGSTWTLQQKIQASDKQTFSFFGDQVSINSDGTYAIVGAKYYGGAAYIFTRSGSTWTQQAKLLASDLDTNNHQFGYSVSINSDGTYAIIGDFYNDTNGTDCGAAYIFTRSGSTWTEQQKIQASDIQANDEFGISVSINSDATYAIVGSYKEDGGAGDPTSAAGAAYVFTRSGSTWTQQAKLVAPSLTVNGSFGNKVSINPNATYAMIGSMYENTTGAVYIFTRSGSTWTQQAKLVASDPQATDYFGDSLSMNSDASYAIVGAKFEDGGAGDPTSNAGVAYLFERSGSTWTQVQRLTSSDIQAGDEFGWSVSMSGDGTWIFIGAHAEDGGAGDPYADTGAVYIYEAG